MTDSNEQKPGFFKSIARDPGFQSAGATLIVSVLVAGAKRLIFRA